MKLALDGNWCMAARRCADLPFLMVTALAVVVDPEIWRFPHFALSLVLSDSLSFEVLSHSARPVPNPPTTATMFFFGFGKLIYGE
jgi:hypothetical protein